MEFFSIPIDLLSVLIAAVVSFVIGFVWYHPRVFGKAWQQLVGMTPEGVKSNMLVSMIGGAVVTLVTAFLIAWVLPGMMLILFGMLADAGALVYGLVAGFVLWLFPGLTMLMNMLYAKSRKKLFLINAAYSLVSFLVMAAVIALMYQR